MKNVKKIVGNLTRARRVPLVIIAIVAVIGFTFAACDDGGGDDGGGGKTYIIGDTGPGGGKIFWEGNDSDSWRYLEVAPINLGEYSWSGAVSACKNYRGGGKSDWFLPSIHELSRMYITRDLLGISSGSFWSSDAIDEDYAYYYNFREGKYNYTLKLFSGSVRPIRAFSP